MLEEEKKKKEYWDLLVSKMTEIEMSSVEQDFVKQDILHQEAKINREKYLIFSLFEDEKKYHLLILIQ